MKSQAAFVMAGGGFFHYLLRTNTGADAAPVHEQKASLSLHSN